MPTGVSPMTVSRVALNNAGATEDIVYRCS